MQRTFLAFFFVIFLVSTGYSDFYGKKITAVEFSGEHRAKEKNLMSIITVKVGDTFSRKSIRRSVNLLYTKGIYENITVNAEDHDDGVRLTFELVGKYLLRDIKVKGNYPFVKDTILKVASIVLNEEYEEEQIVRYKKRLLDFFKGEGHRKADVTIEEMVDHDLKNVILNITIKKGFKTRIDDVKVTGEPFFISKRIQKKSRLFYSLPFIKKGKILKKSTLENSLKNIEEYYYGKGFLRASIEKPEIILDEEKNSANIIMVLDSGINLRFDINTDFFWFVLNKAKTNNDLIRIARQYIYNQNTYITNVSKKIDEYFEQRGFLDCEITQKKEEKRGTLFLNFIIETGERIKINNLTITGNDKESFPDKILKKFILTKKGKIPGMIPGYFSPGEIEEDLKNIVSLYHSKGFLKAEANYKLTKRLDDPFKGDILIKISEGNQTIIDNIIFNGNNSFPDRHLRSKLKFSENDPFDAGKAIAGGKEILSYYRENGYANSQVEENHTIDFKKKTAEITYNLFEGNQFYFGKTIIRGHPRTRNSIILNNITFKEGDKYNFKQIESSQRKLYQKKIFNRLEFQSRDYHDKKDIILNLREKKKAIFELNFGYNHLEGLDYQTSGYLINPFGFGTIVSGKVEFSRIKEGYNITFSKSLNFIDAISNLSYLRLKKESYSVKNFGFRLDFKRHIYKWLEGSIGYHYDSAELFDVKPEAVLEWDDEGHVNVGSLVFSTFIDKRDDPILTTSGFLGSFTTEFASKYFGSRTNPESAIEYHFLPDYLSKEAEPSPLGYIKFYLKSAVYLPVTNRFILAMALQAGTAYSYEGPEILPIHKRFFLGGSNTIRGFELDTVQSYSVKSLKPNADPDTPIGGNGMLCGNIELRFEVIKKWWLVLFSDIGNVWADIGKFGHIRDDLRYTAGAGIRWVTPIGPLRFDYGFKIDREEEESRGEWYITLGHTF